MCISPQKEGLRVSNEGKEQSSSGQIPAPPQPKGTPAPWSHILLGTQGKQRWLSSPTQSGGCAAALGHSCSPALPVTHIPPSLPCQSLQFPHTPSEGQEERHGGHLELLNPHPGCSITTRVRNPATSSPSQTLSLAWQSPELGELLSQAHRNTTTTEIKPVTEKGHTQALWILSNTKPNSLAV